MTLCDAGPLVALLDSGQSERHKQCLNALRLVTMPLVTTWPCFAEAMYLLGRNLGYPGQEALWRMCASGRVVLHESSQDEADRMATLMAQYRDTPMDLADASLVTTAESLSLTRIFTLDHHFYAYRTLDGHALEVLP
jgi:predicted nucleic acid-binding protein